MFYVWLAADVAAAATCTRQNADRYKSMEIVAFAFVRRIRQKIEIQNKLLIISVHSSVLLTDSQEKKIAEKNAATRINEWYIQRQQQHKIRKMCIDVTQ